MSKCDFCIYGINGQCTAVTDLKHYCAIAIDRLMRTFSHNEIGLQIRGEEETGNE